MDDAEIDLIRLIVSVSDKYPRLFGNYEAPYLRSDGDIVIPLNPILKKNRESHRRFAEAMRDMMNSDVERKKKKSKSWV